MSYYRIHIQDFDTSVIKSNAYGVHPSNSKQRVLVTTIKTLWTYIKEHSGSKEYVSQRQNQHPRQGWHQEAWKDTKRFKSFSTPLGMLFSSICFPPSSYGHYSQCEKNQARSYMSGPTLHIQFGSVLPKKTWITLCKTSLDVIWMVWSGFGQTHRIRKLASVQE